MRRRLTCHHEAGHALVRWYFGHRTDRAVVQTVEEVRNGVPILTGHGDQIFCEALVDGYDIIGYPFGPLKVNGSQEEQTRINRSRSIARDIELMNCYAGFVAEAHYRRISPKVCMFAGGLRDLEQARTVLDAWQLSEMDEHALRELSYDRAVALVRSRHGSAAIRAMADALMERGEIDGVEIAALCRDAYGGRKCAFGAWSRHWPPTIGQLRAGYIPEPVPAAA
ncbi:hypothetical protein [Methylorubrum thiocyanatum]|uniref:hypothetical protein n=1 Tax=Methylorubrum thiocyanatum TaxID=47958 RepID=UPI0035C833F1